jgi:uncharacterized protein YecT (DUF1311 family)
MKKFFYLSLYVLFVMSSCSSEKISHMTPAPALADFQIQKRDCGDRTNQADMNDCFKQEADDADKLLARLMIDLREHLDTTQLENLHIIQEQWIVFRDANCEWTAALFEGASIQPTMFQTCLASHTWARINELKDNLCEGYGMTGSCTESDQYNIPE